MIENRRDANGPLPPKPHDPRSYDERQIAWTAVAIVLDQFYGPTPSVLYGHPMAWDDFTRAVDAGAYTPGPYAGRQPLVTTVSAVERDQEWATTAYRRDANGYVEAFRMRWDSSG